MLPPYQMKQTKKFFYYVFVFALMLSSFSVHAQADIPSVTTLSAVDIIKNLAAQVPTLMQMVTAIAYVMGMYLIFAGILKLKQYGEQRSMMSQEQSLKGPLILITIGTLLLYLPTSVQVGMSTFWAQPNPYGYLVQEDSWSQFINACFLIVQLVGTIAFIRGLLILSSLGGHGGHQQAFGKGITHIIGGIFCINIYQVVQVIMITIGIET